MKASLYSQAGLAVRVVLHLREASAVVVEVVADGVETVLEDAVVAAAEEEAESGNQQVPMP